MSIASLCTRKLAMADRGMSPREAAWLMRQHHVGALVVTEDSHARVAGIVTDRDLVTGVLAREGGSDGVTLAELMSTRLVAVPVQAALPDAVATMRDEGVRRLLVVDGKSAVVGIVTMDDIVEAIAALLADLSGALRAGTARESLGDGPLPAPRSDGPVLSPQALAARWRQITSA